MLVIQTNPLGVELFSYVNTSFCFSKFACVPAMCVKTLYCDIIAFLVSARDGKFSMGSISQK